MLYIISSKGHRQCRQNLLHDVGVASWTFSVPSAISTNAIVGATLHLKPCFAREAQSGNPASEVVHTILRERARRDQLLLKLTGLSLQTVCRSIRPRMLSGRW